MKGKVLNALGLLLGIGVGVGLLYVLISTRPESKKGKPPDSRPLAEVMSVFPQTYAAIVEGYGPVPYSNGHNDRFWFNDWYYRNARLSSSTHPDHGRHEGVFQKTGIERLEGF